MIKCCLYNCEEVSHFLTTTIEYEKEDKEREVREREGGRQMKKDKTGSKAK